MVLLQKIEIKLHRKLAKFIINMIHSENQYVYSVLKQLFISSSSIIAENFRLLSYMYGISSSDWETGINNNNNNNNNLYSYSRYNLKTRKQKGD